MATGAAMKDCLVRRDRARQVPVDRSQAHGRRRDEDGTHARQRARVVRGLGHHVHAIQAAPEDHQGIGHEEYHAARRRQGTGASPEVSAREP